MTGVGPGVLPGLVRAAQAGLVVDEGVVAMVGEEVMVVVVVVVVTRASPVVSRS